MMTPNDYQGMFDNAVMTDHPSLLRQIDYICRTIQTNEVTYRGVMLMARVPWVCVAAIHSRESDLNFKCHLHNGDPLTARTVRVPAGRPILGSPPFTWQESAADALSDRWRPRQWDLPGMLEFMERYNGLGYRMRGAVSPYLWDATSAYQSGLFVADGSFDLNAKESRAGCAALLKGLALRGASLDFSALATLDPLLH